MLAMHVETDVLDVSVISELISLRQEDARDPETLLRVLDYFGKEYSSKFLTREIRQVEKDVLEIIEVIDHNLISGVITLRKEGKITNEEYQDLLYSGAPNISLCAMGGELYHSIKSQIEPLRIKSLMSQLTRKLTQWFKLVEHATA